MSNPLRLILTRDLDDGSCTLGRLAVAGREFHTIERPWVPDPLSRGGRKGVSCVPCGTYSLVPYSSETQPKVFALVNHDLDVYVDERSVPRGLELQTRTYVLIHAANYAGQLRGCIAPGMRREFVDLRWMVTSSRRAMAKLSEVVPWVHGHTLVIRSEA